MGKTWKDSMYSKVRLPRIPSGKVMKSAKFPSRNNEKVRIKDKEYVDAEDATKYDE